MRAISGNKTVDALLSAEAWVREPEETTRRAALNIGWTRDARIAATWLALAAGQSGGSIAPEGAHPVAPPAQATALDVKAAVILAIEESPSHSQSVSNIGVRRSRDTVRGGRRRQGARAGARRPEIRCRLTSPHGVGPVTAKLCKMAKCEISYGDVRRSVRAISM